MEEAAAAAATKPAVAVVVVPFPAQGHLNQLLHFSCLLSARGVPVHYAASATHNRQAKLRLEGWDPLTVSNIRFHDLHLPPFPTPPPDPHAPTKFPDHLLPAFEASKLLRLPFATLLRSLYTSARRIAVVYESLMSFAGKEASDLPNAESYHFHSSSAFSIFFLEQEFDLAAKPNSEVADFSGLPPLPIDGCFTKGFVDFLTSQGETMAIPAAGHLINTCRPIEGRFLDLWAQGRFGKYWAIGPLNPTASRSSSRGRRTVRSRRHHWCLEWLDKQPPKSVIYVSFGTMSSISDEQICEIATGLERSGQRFVWVVREADRGDIFAAAGGGRGGEGEVVRKMELPEGYEERVAEVGRVVRDWAPQVEILSHPSVGGFMSHCGWNSCMESMSTGVPIAAWPMHSDQPRNAMLVTEVLRIGVMVWEWSRREEMASAEAVDAAVRRLMASEEGKEIRNRAEELGREVGKVWLEDGSSCLDLDSFISHISRE